MPSFALLSRSDRATFAERIAQIASALVLLGSALVLLGWALDLGLLKSLAADLPLMMPNTAVALGLGGIALWLLRREPVGSIRSAMGGIAAGGLAVIGILTLAEHLGGWALGIDRLLLPAASAPEVTGRPTLQTALALTLLGLALGLLDVHLPRNFQVAQVLAVLAILIGLLALIGYASRTPFFYGAVRGAPHLGMSLHTTLLVILLGVGTLCARPGRGLTAVVLSPGAGGTVARRLMLAPVVVPLVVGWVRIAGQYLGLLQPEFGGYFFSLGTVVVFTLLIWWSASVLHRSYAERGRAEERFRVVAETAAEAIVSADGAGSIVYLNQAAERLFGHTSAQAVGQPLTLLMPARFHADHERGLERYVLTHESRVMGKTVELAGRRRDGSEFPMELSLANWEADGEIFFTGILRDISERKRREEELHQLNGQLRELSRELEDRVTRRTAELQGKTEELRTTSQQLWNTAKLATMGELAASIAHELNNPLTTILLHLESLEREAAATPPSPPSQGGDGAVLSPPSQGGGRGGAAHRLQVIDQEVSRMANLVANLLQFSRPAQQHVSTVDIHEELDKTLEIINYQFKKSEIGVVREYAAGLPMIQVDRQKLRQVILNLLMNASDAMRGGGTIKLRTQASTLADGNPAITAEVADTGGGIPPEDLGKVMEPFFTTKPEGKGTGLGLPICRRIIQEHKGTIEIASEMQRGTTVRIVLPVAHAAGTELE